MADQLDGSKLITRRAARWLVVALGVALCACGDDDAPRDRDASSVDGAVSADGAMPMDGAMPSDDAGADPDSGFPPLLAPLVSGSHDVLFVGNSYVFTNDVSGRYRAIADTLPFSPVRVEAVAFGGYRFVQHADDAMNDDTPLAMFLRTGMPDARNFDAVIFQEQSQIGGLLETHRERIESLAAASELAALATANESAVVLYLTWGRRDGDPMNSIFPTFEAMQGELDRGYRAMAAQLRTEGAVVRVAPVGAAFRAVFDELVARGDDPLTEGSNFFALYEPDGSHPSPRGAYLAACVLAATVTGESPERFPDGAGLDAATSTALREVAASVIASDEWSDELRDTP